MLAKACRLFLLLCATTALAQGAIAQEQRIAAIVNDSVVSLQDLNERLGMVVLTSRIPDSDEARRRLAPQVLRGLIEETLQLQEAERLQVTVEQSDLDQALANIAERNKMAVEDMMGYLESNGVDPATLIAQLRAQIAWIKIVNRVIRPQVNVSVDQLELAVEEAQRNQGQPEFLLSEIVLPVDNPEQEAEVAEDAARLAQTLAEGASFESLARQVSASSTAEQGGNVGWVQASSLPRELVIALERLRPGEVSEPIRTPVGFYFFQLRDRRLVEAPDSAQDGQEREIRLSQILFEGEGGQPSENRIREAAALRERLTDCNAVNQVAAELGAPASGDLGWLKLSDLPPELSEPVAALQVGEISAPLEGPAGIHLLMVCERRGDSVDNAASQLDEEARARLTEQLERERIDRLARRYLRDLRKAAFVDVRL